MKSTKTKILLSALIFICLTSVAFTQDQQIPTRQIIFETSDQQEDWQLDWEGLGVIRPKYLAKFTLLDNRTMVRSRRYVTTEAEQWLKKVVSEQQQALINQSRYSYSEPADNADLYRTFWLYAVSGDEARKMAEGFIKYYDQVAHIEFQEIKDGIAENQKTIADVDQRLPQLEVESKAINKQFMDYGARYDLNRKVAQERNKELYEMLSHLKIDLAGTQAKVEVVRKYMVSIRETVSGGQNQLYATARQMLIELEAELASALARKKEIETQIAHADEFIQIQSKRNSLSSEYNRLNNDKDRAQNRIQKSEQTLANPPAELLPVELLENKVTIHPVREK